MALALATFNPATGALLERFDPLEEAALDAKLALAARRVRQPAPLAARAGWTHRAAELLIAERQVLGRLISVEMGKPIRAACAEIDKCAAACRYYADNAGQMLADEPVVTEAAESFVRYEPLGVVLAIMPWNFPFWQVFRFAAPALMAGNVALLKHASNVPRCALAIEDVLRRAGFPEGTFQTLLIGAPRVAALIADERVAAVTLTGSDETGSRVAAEAGKHLKKTVLELGGSDPFIVLPSADLERAARGAAAARTINAGQSCIAAKRFIVHERIADEFEARFVAAMGALRVGDPLDETTDVGPLATEEIRHGLEAQVAATLAAGAHCALGGHRLEGPGFFYAPTVLTRVPPSSPGAREELFGPVACVFRVPSAHAALDLANATPFGLGASVWTGDRAERDLAIERLESGQVFVNALVASDPRLPFGGVKRSGFGRELGAFGAREFTNVKTVWIAPS